MITEITRNSIFSQIHSYWHGSLSPIEFLERIYPLDSLPSEDSRFKTFRSDIIEHAIDNHDWENDWIFNDKRLALTDTDKLLRLLSEVFHPVVSRDVDITFERVNEINQLLRVDGYELYESNHQSGYPIFAYRKIQPQIRPLGSIPDSIIATLGPILAQRYSHSELDTLFERHDFPRPANFGSNKVTKAKAWLAQANKIRGFDRWGALGQILEELMEQNTNGLISDEQIAADNAQIHAILRKKNLTYANNGIILREDSSREMQIAERIDLLPWLSEENKLGEGGFGKVYRYEDNRLQMSFAIKVYDPSPFQSDPEKGKKRFFREASLLFKLRNKHIIQIYDAAELPDGRPYIKMEYFAGASLQEHLSNYGLLTAYNRLTVIGRIALALQHAHEQNIMHRDLKPSNVLVDPSNYDIRLIDFGLGVLVEEAVTRTRLTHTKDGLSASPYLAPELMEDSKLLNSKSDVYSLGAIWFKMLVGLSPQGTGIDEALRKSTASKTELDLIRGCLSLDAGKRPDCSVLIDQLRQLIRSTKNAS